MRMLRGSAGRAHRGGDAEGGEGDGDRLHGRERRGWDEGAEGNSRGSQGERGESEGWRNGREEDDGGGNEPHFREHAGTLLLHLLSEEDPLIDIQSQSPCDLIIITTIRPHVILYPL